jgi:RNA polymerase sigma-70 factor (ECF subfamily)
VDVTTTSAGLFSLSAPECQSRVSKDSIDLSRSKGESLSDELLLDLVRHEDRNALGLLFRRYAGSLYTIGRRILRDDSEAEDLVQEVFLYIHTKSGHFDSSKGTARSWIFQIAYTQAFLKRRTLKHHGLYSQGIAENPGGTQTRAKSSADYDQTPEGLFGRNGWRRILKSLTDDQRETLRLHFFEGCTFGEIAEKLGQSYANVRNHHYRGVEKVRKHLAEDVLNRR